MFILFVPFYFQNGNIWKYVTETRRKIGYPNTNNRIIISA